MHDLSLLTTVAAGFACAWVLGLITQALRLSPIVGYLLAGIVVGPYTPGFVGNVEIAHQLAEIGVILLMFGVGLHFHFKDLLAVKGIAVPGALGQSAMATLAAIIIFHFFGWPLKASFVLGMAMAVASTVVLMRVLMDKDMLNSVHGHVAVGWLIVEDIFTVLMLVFIPMLAVGTQTDVAGEALVQSANLMTVVWAFVKLIALVAIVLLAGSRVVPWILAQVARLRSQELFTLTILVLSIAVAVGSSELFGASVALGAFLAGMVVGQSPVSHQAAADALPMRDAFAVLFFVAVGMLFDPAFLIKEPLIVMAALAIVLIVKPMTALIIVALVGYSARTALTVALGLAQIGEFSFILSQVARKHGLIPEEGHFVLVAAAIISITINPLLFGWIDRIEGMLKKSPAIWRLLNARADRRMNLLNQQTRTKISESPKPTAVIVGYGPVGRVVDALLRDSGMETVIIETNMDTVQTLTKSGRLAIFGDASRMEILKQAGIKQAVHLVVTLPHASMRGPLVIAARDLNPSIEITVRARYLKEREVLELAGASKMVFEEGEAGLAMAEHVLRRRGMNEATIDKMLAALRQLWKMDIVK